jgi:hypothetical protein
MKIRVEMKDGNVYVRHFAKLVFTDKIEVKVELPTDLVPREIITFDALDIQHIMITDLDK